MPEGEEMFKFHGYSGNCPKPQLPRQPTKQKVPGLIWAVAVNTECEVKMRFDTPDQANAFVAGLEADDAPNLMWKGELK